MAFYDLMFNQKKPREAIERYAGKVYIQHNPAVAEGKEAFIDKLRKNGQRVSKQTGTLQTCDAEGNYVVLHCYQQWPGDTSDWAGIDIFRLDDNSCKIMEHWDVLQRIPQRSANDNTMF